MWMDAYPCREFDLFPIHHAYVARVFVRIFCAVFMFHIRVFSIVCHYDKQKLMSKNGA